MCTFSEIMHTPAIKTLAELHGEILRVSSEIAKTEKKLREVTGEVIRKKKTDLAADPEYRANLKLKELLEAAVDDLRKGYIEFFYDPKADDWDFRKYDVVMEEKLAPSLRFLRDEISKTSAKIKRAEADAENNGAAAKIKKRFNALCKQIKELEDKYDETVKLFSWAYDVDNAVIAPIKNAITRAKGKNIFTKLNFENQKGASKIIVCVTYSRDVVGETEDDGFTSKSELVADTIGDIVEADIETIATILRKNFGNANDDIVAPACDSDKLISDTCNNRYKRYSDDNP